MFAALRSINLLNEEYRIRFEAMLTDNGAELASRGNAAGHPVERLLGELGIKHRCRGPYRPQTNGKLGRFWRTLNEELLEGTTFETADELKEEYRPPTNGKVGRFWRTLNEELLEGTTFETADELQEELGPACCAPTRLRPHQDLGGKTPHQAL